jgi:phage N-6-adenine-methyltransferase
MSDELIPIDGGREIEQFDPERYHLKQAALNYGIEEAKRIKDWPTLEKAVDEKIEDGQKFTAWWKANVGAGKGQKGKRRDHGVLSEPEAECLTRMPHQRVSDLNKKLKNLDAFRAFLLGTEYRAACLEGVDNIRGTGGTGENEWYTPAEYLELARAVIGQFDLDPASSEAAQKVVKANKFFTKEDDGLSKEWHGSVWLNPPYAQPLIAEFVEKLLEELAAEHTTTAILLTHNYTDTAWFQSAFKEARAICFPRGRIRFEGPKGEIAAPTQGQAFFYFGSDINKFTHHFDKIGSIALPHNRGI